MVYALKNFRTYLIGAKVIVHIGYSTLKYLLAKKDAKSRLIRCMLLFQEFNMEIQDKKGSKKVVANHFPRLGNEEIVDK